MQHLRRFIFFYIGELSRLVQDLLTYMDDTDGDALLLACDQAKAYDMIDHTFMRKVLCTMEVPTDFIRLVEMCYTKNTVRVKINGHLSPIFRSHLLTV